MTPFAVVMRSTCRPLSPNAPTRTGNGMVDLQGIRCDAAPALHQSCEERHADDQLSEQQRNYSDRFRGTHIPR
jgi:hypothetical protein